MKKNLGSFLLFFGLTLGCEGEKPFDATGVFETEETVISAQVTGRIKEFNIEEGQTIKKGQRIGYIDTAQLYFNKRNLEAQIELSLSKKPEIAKQVAALRVQLANAQHEEERLKKLVKAQAATQKQLDDQGFLVRQIQKQIDAELSTLRISTRSLNKETVPTLHLIEQIKDQLEKSYIINPLTGTVLAKYARLYEEASPGRALYKIADISSLLLRAYITNEQFTQLKLGQKVKVYVFTTPEHMKEYEGLVIWISDKAEFTPKTIQTKDERANLVWATKIKVKNDGYLKIGMYADVRF